MDILEKLKLRIEFEKVQSCLFYKEGKLNVNLLRTYTIDTINHLLLNYNEDHEFVQILKSSTLAFVLLSAGLVLNKANEG